MACNNEIFCITTYKRGMSCHQNETVDRNFNINAVVFVDDNVTRFDILTGRCGDDSQCEISGSLRLRGTVSQNAVMFMTHNIHFRVQVALPQNVPWRYILKFVL
jgi:hypothetical protein